MAKSIPPLPNLEFDKKQAKALLKALRAGDESAFTRFRTHHPRIQDTSLSDLPHTRITLADAQLVIAREYGVSSWSAYLREVRTMMTEISLFDKAIDAVIHGNAATLKTLLTDHPELATARSLNGKGKATLLHYVAANGVEDHLQQTPPNAVEIAEILFTAGADPNATADIYGGGAGSTPLVGLVSSVHPHEAGVQTDLVRVFVRHGAKPNGILGDGRPLATALETWYPLAFKTLVDSGATLDNLVFAASAGRNDLVETMLSAETLTPYTNALGEVIYDNETIRQIAFVKACLCGQLATVQLLQAHGVPLNGRIKHSRTGLHEAAYGGELDVVRWLVDNGADVGIRDSQFNSLPVHWANAAGRRDVYDYLLPRSPLTLADCAEFGLIERVKAILDADPAMVNGDNHNGAPLFEAIGGGHMEIVRVLLDSSADTTLTNSRGMTALELATRRGHERIAELIRKHNLEAQ
ncbi:MAG: ankyrin repeat domain-containing protein [Aggregatilineales bacterium]